MHIPDGVLDPTVALATGTVAVAGLGYALRRMEKHLGERTTVLMGVMSAFVFAAQMVNFPVALGVSGHLLGGVLAAVLLGPWAGAVVIGAVLIVQCALFGDGGLTALGANFLNMGLIGSVGGYAVYAPVRCALGGRAGVLVGAMVAAWFAVLLASGAFAIELAASGRWSDFLRVLSWMMLVHSAIGVGEALITGLVLRFLLLVRPDLVYESEGIAPSPAACRWQVAVGGLAVALAVAAFLAPFASASPDGLEYVGAKLGFLHDGARPVIAAPLAEYELPLPGLKETRIASAVVGILGTLVVFAVGLGLARVFGAREREAAERPAEVSPHAA